MTSKGLEMLEILKQRNDTLKINHKIGSRDIANQEIKEITQCFDNYVIPVIEKDLDRLEQLEDIEEELGIELPDMFNIYEKICKQNFVYIIENEKIIKENLGSVRHLINPKEKQFEAIYLDAIATYKFVDYGKKWALTREELEND